MRTHILISKALKNSTGADRVAVERADKADKRERSYHGPGNAHRVLTTQDTLDLMHADLLIAGVEQVNGMAIDLWLSRSLKDILKQ